MRSAIISIGTELLMGQVTDTNAVYLSKEMNLLGFDVLYQYTVGDNAGRLRKILEIASEDVDLILVTGGLGPTEDDITKEVISEFFGRELSLHKPSRDALKNMEKERGVRFTENNLKQVMMPEGAEVFATDAGTAPGFSLSNDRVTIVAMPGPPFEMRDMFTKKVGPYLEQFVDGTIYYKVLRMFGIGESAMETEIMDLVDAQTDPTIGTYAEPCECSVRIASKGRTRREAESRVEVMADKIRAILGDKVYSDDGSHLPETLVELLKDRGLTLASAESCTGGMFSEMVTSVPGASAVFNRGIATYASSSKTDELGVSAELIKEKTAVCSEVAAQMAEGLERKTGCDICLSVTGVAGPGPSEGNPAGLIYIGCRYGGETCVKKLFTLNVSRDWNRRYATLAMFDLARRRICGLPWE